MFCLASSFGRPAEAEALSSQAISHVVESRRGAVRHTCWEPALLARRDEGSVIVRIQTSFVITASGEVTSIASSGAERSFPGLSSCVASSIQKWRFPTSDAPTPIKVPFLFVAQ